ncbi:unnamed protein product [Owenia fusiformis]|uniref:Methionyl-tRNA formyltransferase, mitochondrial n=1 Tax=Owenia fusiformis TaxID=6347 RepID=A0A8J1TU79_OWEFU|nr:unnamed protein product [Owenia fusiformis]
MQSLSSPLCRRLGGIPVRFTCTRNFHGSLTPNELLNRIRTCHAKHGCWNLKELPIIPSRIYPTKAITNTQNIRQFSSLPKTSFIGAIFKHSKSCKFESTFSTYSDGTISHDQFRHEPPWRILFFGTDHFSLASLRALRENLKDSTSSLVESIEVVTINKKCAVRDYAEQENLKIYPWPSPVMMEKYDVGVVASFGHLIPGKIIRMFPYGVVNVHPSLLPRWRGASPVVHTILNGDEVTGVTITEIRPKHFDIGPILIQEPYYLTEKFSTFELRKILAAKGSQLLMRSLLDLPKLERYEQPQDPSGITYAHKVTASMSIVDWADQTRDQIDRQHRALSEIFMLRSEYQDQAVKLFDMVDKHTMASAVVQEQIYKRFGDSHVHPGTMIYISKEKVLAVCCKDGWVGFRKIIHKKKMTAQEFNNGYLNKSKDRLILLRSLSNTLNKYIFRVRV